MVIRVQPHVLYATNLQANVLVMDVPATEATTQGTLLGIMETTEM
jgi:hypothetical protein